MSILVTGSRGYLGGMVCNVLRKQGYEVIGTRRPNQEASSSQEVVLEAFEAIDCKNFQLDAVIHLAGIYSPLGLAADDNQIFHTNVGLASSVAQLITDSGIPAVVTGSYFEKCPASQHPWSPYAASKEAGRIILKTAALKAMSQVSYLYLYDNYGVNSRRGKFVDQMLELILSRKSLQASSGKQKVNLTHELDVVNGIVSALKTTNTSGSYFCEYQISSDETFTLRELVEITNSVIGQELEVNWGLIKDREKEVYDLWDSAAPLPYWSPTTSFLKFLESNFKNIV